MGRYADIKMRVGAPVVADTGNPAAVVLPGPVIKDEIIVLLVISDDNVSSSSSGYTAKIETNAGTTCRASVLWKRAAGGDANPTVTHTAGEGIMVVPFILRGCVRTGDPIEASGATGTQNSATVSYPSITTVTPQAMVVAFGGLTTDEDTSGSPTWGALSGEGAALLTEVLDTFSGANTDMVAISISRGWQASPGATTARTATIAGGVAAQDQVGTMLAFTPELITQQLVIDAEELALGTAAYALASRLDLTAGFRFLIHDAGGGSALTASIDDTLSISDAVTLEVQMVVAETLAIADAVALQVQKVIADALAIADAQALTEQKLIADTLAIADSVLAETGKEALVDDTLAIADSVVTFVERNALINDALAIADALALVVQMTVADTLAIADAVAAERGLSILIEDEIGTGGGSVTIEAPVLVMVDGRLCLRVGGRFYTRL